MKLILSRFYSWVVFIMTASTKCDSVRDFYAKFGKVFIRFNMMDNKTLFAALAALDTPESISGHNSCSPIFVGPGVSPFIRKFACYCFNTLVSLGYYLNFSSRFIRTIPATIFSFSFLKRVFIENFFTPKTVFVSTSFGHQYEYIKERS